MEVIPEIPEVIFRNVRILIYILQALGVAVLIYVVFGLINLLFLKKRNNVLNKISNDLDDIKSLLKKK